MVNSWFGIEQILERIEHHKCIGIIGIDLTEWRHEYSSVFSEEDMNWTHWLSMSMGRSDLWYGDEVAGHLWLYAQLPEDLGEEESESYLRGLARRVREAIIAEAGSEIIMSSGMPRHMERGIGYAKLRDWRSAPVKDIIYEGVLKAAGQIRDSQIDQSDWDLRFELDRLLTESSIKSVYQPIMRLGDGKVFGYEALTRCPEGSLFDGR